jgi:5-formyltetrahydrofolate cyclo-ligase
MKNVSKQKELFRIAFFKQHKRFRSAQIQFRDALSQVFETLTLFLAQFEEAKSLKIAAYESLPSEVPMEQWLRRLGYEFWTPEVEGESLIFRKSNAAALLKEMDLIFTPALLVSENGNRLGRGGGYYDRALIEVTEKKRVFVGFDWQVRNKLPIGSHDQTIHWIVSESGVRQIRT